jgi:hypothetical protein
MQFTLRATRWFDASDSCFGGNSKGVANNIRPSFGKMTRRFAAGRSERAQYGADHTRRKPCMHLTCIDAFLNLDYGPIRRYRFGQRVEALTNTRGLKVGHIPRFPLRMSPIKLGNCV